MTPFGGFTGHEFTPWDKRRGSGSEENPSPSLENPPSQAISQALRDAIQRRSHWLAPGGGEVAYKDAPRTLARRIETLTTEVLEAAGFKESAHVDESPPQKRIRHRGREWWFEGKRLGYTPHSKSNWIEMHDPISFIESHETGLLIGQNDGVWRLEGITRETWCLRPPPGKTYGYA